MGTVTTPPGGAAEAVAGLPPGIRVRFGRLVLAEVRRAARRRAARAVPVAMAALMVVIVGGAMLQGATFAGDDLVETLRNLTRFLLPVAAAVGAAIEGSWFTSRTLTELLTWEPRRHRVLGAQLLAVGAVLAAVVLLADLAVAAGLVIWSLWSEQAPPAEHLAEGAGVIVATAAVGLLAGVLGAAIAALTRSPASAVAIVLVGYLMVEQLLVQALLATVDTYAAGVLPLGSLVEWVAPLPADQLGVDRVPVPASLAAFGWLALLVGGALIATRRRDLA